MTQSFNIPPFTFSPTNGDIEHQLDIEDYTANRREVYKNLHSHRSVHKDERKLWEVNMEAAQNHTPVGGY